MEDGIITSFKSGRPGSPGTFTFCGLHLVSPKILEYIPENVPSSIVDAYANAMKNGDAVHGVVAPTSFWADVGTPAGYLDAHRSVLKAYRKGSAGYRLFVPQQMRHITQMKRAGVIVSGFASIGQNVRIGRNVTITDSVIWDNAGIGAGSRITNAIVADKVTIRGTVSGIAVRADSTADSCIKTALDEIGWPAHDTALIPLAARGSARDFFRIQHGKQTAILVRYSLDRPENALYAQNARFLAKIGVRVPHIILSNPDDRVIVMEDAGDHSLRDLVYRKSARKTISMYQRIITSMLVFHRRGRCQSEKTGLILREPFSSDLYRWERELFARHFLGNHLHLPDIAFGEIMLDLEHVARKLLKEPLVLIHRDLQSTNVLFHRNEPVLIDFQGMRLGAATYDLASLLCDPYVSLPPAIQNALLDFYAARTRQDAEEVKRRFWLAAVERLVQAIGAFSKLGSSPETSRFIRYIEPGLAMLNRALSHLDNFSHLKDVVCYAMDRQRGGKQR